MARNRVTERVLTSWEEVNESLKAIGNAQNEMAKIDADLNTEIDVLKASAKQKALEHEDTIKVQEALIQQFTTEHKDELKGKSKKLAFGTLGFRLSTKVIVPKQVQTIIENLKKNGMSDCLNISIKVNKDILKTYSEDDIVKVGASLKKEDTFWYETEKNTVQDK